MHSHPYHRAAGEYVCGIPLLVLMMRHIVSWHAYLPLRYYVSYSVCAIGRGVVYPGGLDWWYSSSSQWTNVSVASHYA
jgi:hypothetical protein